MKRLLLITLLSGCAAADEDVLSTDYLVEDMLPGYVCMTKDQTKSMNESSRMLGYRQGYSDAKKDIIRQMKVQLHYACLEKNKGGEGEFRVGSSLVFKCK